MISEKQKYAAAAVASELAAKLYWLNILEKNIQDQDGNTTKFLIVVWQDQKELSFWLKKWRITFLFKTNHTPGSLYHCLEIFAKKQINLTKIESIPLGTGHFSYGFWVTIEGSLSDIHIQEAFESLKEKSDFLKILWEY